MFFPPSYYKIVGTSKLDNFAIMTSHVGTLSMFVNSHLKFRILSFRNRVWMNIIRWFYTICEHDEYIFIYELFHYVFFNKTFTIMIRLNTSANFSPLYLFLFLLLPGGGYLEHPHAFFPLRFTYLSDHPVSN